MNSNQLGQLTNFYIGYTSAQQKPYSHHQLCGTFLDSTQHHADPRFHQFRSAAWQSR